MTHGNGLEAIQTLKTAPSTTAAIQWHYPKEKPKLSNGIIHLWCLDTESMGAKWSGFKKALSEQERHQAEKFRFEADKKAFIIRRGALRELAGRYLGIPPGELSFYAGSYGKPFISEQQNQTGLQFSISVTRQKIILAFTKGGHVGVDIEVVRPIEDIDSIAQRFFSPSEAALLRSQPHSEKVRHFYMLWTLKEALLKALGIGLTKGAHLFGARWKADGRIEIVDNRLDGFEPQRWFMKTLNCDEDYCMAIALGATGDIGMRFFRFPYRHIP
jgi:4'-phosphopantetheinyl transferase